MLAGGPNHSSSSVVIGSVLFVCVPFICLVLASIFFRTLAYMGWQLVTYNAEFVAGSEVVRVSIGALGTTNLLEDCI